jgi:hypothetical protein
MWEVGEYMIDEGCFLTYPCKHYIKSKDDYGSTLKLHLATDIFKKLQAKGLTHEHFEYCREIIRKQENPTPEEIAEAQAAEEERERKRVEQEQKWKEKQDLINRTKASSRLERLKAQNNICK